MNISSWSFKMETQNRSQPDSKSLDRLAKTFSNSVCTSQMLSRVSCGRYTRDTNLPLSQIPTWNMTGHRSVSAHAYSWKPMRISPVVTSHYIPTVVSKSSESVPILLAAKVTSDSCFYFGFTRFLCFYCTPCLSVYKARFVWSYFDSPLS